MKTTFIYLLFFAAFNSYTASAANLTKHENDAFSTGTGHSSNAATHKKPEVTAAPDTNLTDALLTITNGYIKTTEDVIREDLKITESNVAATVYPLDFAVIAAMSASVKKEKKSKQFLIKTALPL